MVYKELLCFHSEYFRGAFEGSFRESEEKSIHIKDVSESTFRLFRFWLFAQTTREEAGPIAIKRRGRALGPSGSDLSIAGKWILLEGTFVRVASVAS
jgi:hypothetical protein